MKKYLILAFFTLAQIATAQEARQLFINVDPLEIEGYGIIEAQIRQITDNGHSPRMADPNQPIRDRPRVISDLNLAYTDAESREHRSFTCSKDKVEWSINAIKNFQLLITNPDSLNLQRKGIVKKTLNPPIVLDDDGVESTYTEEYYHNSDRWPIFGIYTNGQGHVVWYYQFGDVQSQEERIKWKVLVNDCKPMLDWLETIFKAM